MYLNIQLDKYRFSPLIEQVEKVRCAIKASAASVVVIQNDHFVAEWYSGHHHAKPGALPVTADSLFNVYSIRKSHIALALAFVVTEAGLDLDAPIHPYIDDVPYDDIKMITLRNVLTKTKPKFFGPEKVEGEGLAARIVKKITGKTISHLITERILEPLQMRNTEWAAVPKESLVCDFTAGDGYASVRLESNEGHERNLYMNAKDLAYWGYLFLKRGLIGGKQIIPKAVLDLSDQLRSTSENPASRIMGWYHQDHLFEAFGATGCHVAVFPRLNAVAVRMYNRYAREHTETILKCLQMGINQELR